LADVSGDTVLQHSRELLPLQVEIEGIREGIRLNWLEMERVDLSQTDRRAIRFNVERLVQTLVRLLDRTESGPTLSL